LGAYIGVALERPGNGYLGKIRNVWEGFEVRPPDFHPDLRDDWPATFKSCRVYQNTAIIHLFTNMYQTIVENMLRTISMAYKATVARFLIRKV